MQKSATPASLALRLNNLEQKFEDFEVPEPGQGDRALADKLAKMTVLGSETAGMSGDWSKNTYYFEGAGKGSFITSVYGFLHWGSLNYDSVSTENPFYAQVFDRHQGYFNTSNRRSLTGAVFGDRWETENNLAFVHDFSSRSLPQLDSLSETIFGNREYVQVVRGGIDWTFGSSKSLVANIFGRNPALINEDIDAVAGDDIVSKTSLLGLMKGLKNRIDTNNDEILRKITALESRVARLESKITW